MNIKPILQKSASEAIKRLFGISIPENDLLLQKTRPEFKGDLTLVIFPITKLTKTPPEPAGEKIGSYLKKHVPEVAGFNVVKGFLNISLSDEFWFNALSEFLKNENFGNSPPSSTVVPVMVEYSSPNTNKPLHLGHIRNNLIGHSISEILKAAGHTVIKANLVNNRGIHICKSMLAWKNWGSGETPDSSGMKGDKLVGKYYVVFEKRIVDQAKEKIISIYNSVLEKDDPLKDILVEFEIPKTIETDYDFNEVKEAFNRGLTTYNKTSKYPSIEEDKFIIEYFKKYTTLFNEVYELLRKWEAGDKETIELWKMMNGWVYKGFDETYNKLGISFDKIYYESETYLLGKKVIEEGINKNVFTKKPDNSVWCDLTPDGLDEKLLLRSDGTSVYMTQDIGTAILRFNDYPDLQQLIYVVGNEQDYHFNVLFLLLKKLGYAWGGNCHHLSYGMVDLPEGKMKSREGTVVDADDLIDEMIETARMTTEELGKLQEIPEDQRLEIYRMIGLGALKYFILKVDPKKRMVFNPKESIDFEGNTGPFIQYTHARIRSLLKKANDQKLQVSGFTFTLHEKERSVIRLILEYPEIVEQAADDLNPSIIANYIYELAKEFNHFYQSLQVLKAESPAILSFRIYLSEMTSRVIKNGMNLLGIEVPERM